MKQKLQRLTVDVPEKTFSEIKLMTIVYKKTMREIIIEAVDALSKQPLKEKEMKQLKNTFYLVKYDSHKDK